MGNLDDVQLVIDTDIVIDFLRRHPETLEKAVAQFEVGITAVTLYELQAIAVRSERQEEALADFLTIAPVLPLNAAAAFAAADVWRTLQQAGALIGLPDTLIAGICLSHNLPLLTRNERHFSRVPTLQLITPVELD